MRGCTFLVTQPVHAAGLWAQWLLQQLCNYLLYTILTLYSKWKCCHLLHQPLFQHTDHIATRCVTSLITKRWIVLHCALSPWCFQSSCFCEPYQMNWKDFDLHRSHVVGSSISSLAYLNMRTFSWSTVYIINLFKPCHRVTENTMGPQNIFCGFAFVVSLDKQEGEFSLFMTRWPISCFFSSIFFFCVNELEIVRRGQEGRKRQSLLVKRW